MKARVDPAKVLMPKARRALQATSNYVNSSGLDHRLLELVKMRTSQLNGCAYCIDMHTKDARAAGETSTPGAKHRSIPSANARRSNGRRR
jgi:AhpD family alkylhydroperoxidase